MFEKSYLFHLFFHIKPSPALFLSLLPGVSKFHGKKKKKQLEVLSSFPCFPFIVQAMAVPDHILYSFIEQALSKIVTEFLLL